MRQTIVALCVCLGACSGAQKVGSKTTETTAGSAAPTAEQLEECPCGDGTSDWSRLPEGSDPEAEPE